ncbi:uncharacterized protein LOC131951377 [Physella acuta]|uniref:uncharacterized protein LOC131951377 n=1 Tax=Physella acuta TaxID=109671 RepID=UPI0027DBAB68|nr:uncharacterized protein LOC131951377 [Physella acuta]XP_059169750.1 uncharacterized protein LOC131951377 [Physella acuta]
MDEDRKQEAEFVHKYVGNYLKEFQWTVGQSSSPFLWEQLAFVFFGDTQPMFTTEQKESIENVTSTCLKLLEKTNDRLCISIVFKYIEIESTDAGVLIPLVRFKKEHDDNFHFIDYTGKVYSTWEEFVSQNSTGSKHMCVPANGVYNTNDDLRFLKIELKDNYKKYKFQYISDGNNQDFRDSDIVKMIKDDLQTISETCNSDGSRLFQEKIRILFCRHAVDSEVVEEIFASIREKFPAEMLNVLLEGFKEVTGEPREVLGKAFFMKDSIHILKYSQQFRTVTLNGTELTMICGLNLHSKAFVQLTEDQKKLILHQADLREEKSFKGLLKAYRFTLNAELEHAKECIKKALDVNDFNNFMLNNRRVWGELKTFQIIRLHELFTKHKREDRNKIYLQLGKIFAENLNCKSFDGFCAAFEYAAQLLHEIHCELRDKYRIETRGMHNVKKKSPAQLDQEASQYIQANIDRHCRDFKQLISDCKRYKNDSLNFGCSKLAAYHFRKHAKHYTSTEESERELKQYFEIAREVLSTKDLEFTWSQDGTVKRYEYRDEKFHAIRIDKDDGTRLIATLIMKL